MVVELNKQPMEYIMLKTPMSLHHIMSWMKITTYQEIWKEVLLSCPLLVRVLN